MKKTKNRGFTYLELLVSISFYSIVVISLLFLFSSVGNNVFLFKEESNELQSLYNLENLIKREVFANKVSQIENNSNLIIHLDNGDIIRFSVNNQDVDYIKTSLQKKFKNISLTYDFANNRVTLTSKTYADTFYLNK